MAFVYRNPITITPTGSIIEVANMLDPSGLEGGWSVQGGRAYTVNLRVTTDNRWIGPIRVIQSLNLRMGDYYQYPMDSFGIASPPTVGLESDAGSFLNSVRARRESEDAKSWVVTMDFTPYDLIHELGDENIADGSKNPLNMRPKVSFGSAKHEVFHAQDLDGKPYTTTAGEPLQDITADEEDRPTLSIVRNEREFDETWFRRYKGHVNSTPFFDYPPNKVKCSEITADQEYEPDYGTYWVVKYEFEIRDDSDVENPPGGDGWKTVLLNRGYREKLTTGADPTEIMIGGKPTSEPMLLTEEGKYVPGADPFYLEFRRYEWADFDELAFPPDLLTRTT